MGGLLNASYFFAALAKQSSFMLGLVVFFGTKSLGQLDTLCWLVYISWFSLLFL